MLAFSDYYAWSLMSPGRNAVRFPSIISANKILSYPGLSRVKQPMKKILRTRKIRTQPLKNMADQPGATIMPAAELRDRVFQDDKTFHRWYPVRE